MAKYWRQNLDGLGSHVKPVIEPLNGLQLMRRGPVEALFRAQDQVTAMSRRIIATGGLRGSLTWSTPDTDPTAMAGTHPGPEDRRQIGAGSADLTPGCFLRLWALVSPSGETQINSNEAGGTTGAIEVEVVWTDQEGSTVTTVHSTTLPGSVAEFGAQPANMWDVMTTVQIADIQPPSVNETVQLRRWSRSPTMQVRIFSVGGARIIDAVVFEQPSDVAFEADDAGSFWTSHLYAPDTPDSPVAPLQYPYQRFSETTPDGDPRGGTWHLQDVHHAQHQRLGPVLFSWSGAKESSPAATAFTTTSTTLVEAAGGGATAWTLGEPGLCVGTGGYARRQSSNSPFVLRDRVAAIPVIARLRVGVTGDSSGLVRVQTRTDSYIDTVVPVGSIAWLSTYGWLEVGINPDDVSALTPQIFVRAGSGLAPVLSIESATVHYAGGYVPAG